MKQLERTRSWNFLFFFFFPIFFFSWGGYYIIFIFFFFYKQRRADPGEVASRVTRGGFFWEGEQIRQENQQAPMILQIQPRPGVGTGMRHMPG